MSFFWRETAILLIALIISLIVNTIYLWISYADIYGPAPKKKEKQFKRAMVDSAGMVVTSTIFVTLGAIIMLISAVISTRNVRKQEQMLTRPFTTVYDSPPGVQRSTVPSRVRNMPD